MNTCKGVSRSMGVEGKGNDADDHVSATRNLVVIVLVVIVIVGAAMDAISGGRQSRGSRIG